MKNLIILFFSIISVSCIQAQVEKMPSPEPSVKLSSVYQEHFPDRGILLPSSSLLSSLPEFPGGVEALSQYIQENLNYPEIAQSHAHEGTVTAEFIIGTDGTTSQVKVLKGIGLGCDEATLDVLERMPKWEPGYQSGKAVAVRYVTQVRFRLY